MTKVHKSQTNVMKFYFTQSYRQIYLNFNKRAINDLIHVRTMEVILMNDGDFMKELVFLPGLHPGS